MAHVLSHLVIYRRWFIGAPKMIKIILMALLLSAAVAAKADQNTDANQLFVEAVQAWNQAKATPANDVSQMEARLRLIEGAERRLKQIIDRYPGSTLAVQLVIGEKVGPLSTEVAATEVIAAKNAIAAKKDELEVARLLTPFENEFEEAKRASEPERKLAALNKIRSALDDLQNRFPGTSATAPALERVDDAIFDAEIELNAQRDREAWQAAELISRSLISLPTDNLDRRRVQLDEIAKRATALSKQFPTAPGVPPLLNEISGELKDLVGMATLARTWADALVMPTSSAQERLRKLEVLRNVSYTLRNERAWHYPQSTLIEKLAAGERVANLSVVDAQQAVRVARDTLGTLPAGTEFLDCPWCPKLVVVPAGSFKTLKNEVKIGKSFAVGKFEVTFDEWSACVDHGDCRHSPHDENSGRRTRPVIHVSWDDAQEYISWLSKQTGEAYRLLSEGEWEYASQGGSGVEQKPRREMDDARCFWCNKETFSKSAPVGTYKPNGYGLHDMVGNVWEWTLDCVAAATMPPNGGPQLGGDCSKHVLRGGAFLQLGTTSASRAVEPNNVRSSLIGFRVARPL